MKQKFIEWFTKNNNGCSPAMEDDRSFVYEMTQHMFEAYQLAWQKVKPDARRWLRSCVQLKQSTTRQCSSQTITMSSAHRRCRK